MFQATIKKVEFGVLHHFAYEVIDNDEKVIVATTRIETMLGDTAVAVHPQDNRYSHLIGLSLRHPFVPQRKMKIIADAYVDPSFGTGAVKITPAHDFNDFDMGKRHNLEMINILSDDGKIDLPDCALFHGQGRFTVRSSIISALKERGLYIEMSNNPGMVLPICNRSKDVVEPRLKPQWFVDCSGRFASNALNAVEKGTLKLIPEGAKKSWDSWLGDCHDWCISRQLWWGHRIPAYRIVKFKRDIEGDWLEEKKLMEDWFIADNENEAKKQALGKHGEYFKDVIMQQDPDVLDTWFSSQLFPFSVFGWPNIEGNEEMAAFYPTSLLETGKDILFFWVARMVMSGLELTEKLPFDTVYLHSMVRDAHGKKMSKSLGNALDPEDVIKGITLNSLKEKVKSGNLDKKQFDSACAGLQKDFPNGIQACGTDALHFGLCAFSNPSNDINLDVVLIENYRCFCNKIW